MQIIRRQYWLSVFTRDKIEDQLWQRSRPSRIDASAHGDQFNCKGHHRRLPASFLTSHRTAGLQPLENPMGTFCGRENVTDKTEMRITLIDTWSFRRSPSTVARSARTFRICEYRCPKRTSWRTSSTLQSGRAKSPAPDPAPPSPCPCRGLQPYPSRGESQPQSTVGWPTCRRAGKSRSDQLRRNRASLWPSRPSRHLWRAATFADSTSK